ncbi:MAG: hypothetical protein ABI415_07645 [Flavitalea sp.]
MARSEGNLFVDGFTGKVGGNMVFRKRRSGSLIVAKNRKRNTLAPTEAQARVREIFREGSIYGKSVMQNPALKAMYEKVAIGNQSAYNLALRDFAKRPEVKSLNTAGYTGQPGSIIVVKAIDDFKVTTVKVSIFSATGDLLEEGDAVVGINGLEWAYTATVLNNAVAGTNIKAIAKDIPGNEGSLEVIL